MVPSSRVLWKAATGWGLSWKSQLVPRVASSLVTLFIPLGPLGNREAAGKVLISLRPRDIRATQRPASRGCEAPGLCDGLCVTELRHISGAGYDHRYLQALSGHQAPGLMPRGASGNRAHRTELPTVPGGLGSGGAAPHQACNPHGLPGGERSVGGQEAPGGRERCLSGRDEPPGVWR